MEATVNASGEVVVGEMNGENFVVQTGPDFDPTHTVYVLDEITLNPPPSTVEDDAFPSEMDCDFADIPVREAAQEQLESEQLMELLRGAVAYVESLDRTMAVIDDVCAGRW
ncbi:MAG: hypothetical protein ACO24H_11070 [Polynucleobacter sp.]